jgi:hypothetical protein
VDLFGFVPGYTKHVFNEGKEPLFLLVLSFLIAFALTRGYTRIARTRGWGSGNVGGVHLHHMVPGMILVLLAGVFSFTQYAENDIVWGILAIVFGAGAALVLDEFALIFHLKDVYWTNEGRSSIDATIIGVLVAGLLLVCTVDSDDPKAATLGIILFDVVFAAITLLKGKLFVGSVSVFVPLVGIVGASRLAKPYSPWAHRRYDPERGKTNRQRAKRARKLERSWRRYETGRLARFERWFVELVGGKPHLRPPDETSAALEQQAELASTVNR